MAFAVRLVGKIVHYTKSCKPKKTRQNLRDKQTNSRSLFLTLIQSQEQEKLDFEIFFETFVNPLYIGRMHLPLQQFDK